MKLRVSRTVWLASVVLIACCGRPLGGETEPAKDAAVDAGDSDAVAPLILGHTLRRHHVLWNGEHYVVTYIGLVDEEYGLWFRLIDERGETMSEPRLVTSEDVQEFQALWKDGELRVFTSAYDYRIQMHRLDGDGQVLAQPVTVVQDMGEWVALRSVLPFGDGYALFWLDDREAQGMYLPYFVRVDANGNELFPHVLLQEGLDYVDTAGDLVERDGVFTLLWSLRDAVDPDLVHVSQFDEFGARHGPPQVVYTADLASLAYSGRNFAQRPAGELAVVWNLDRGILVVETHDGAASAEHLVVESDKAGHANVAVLDNGQVGVLYNSREGLSDATAHRDLWFVLVDPLDWSVREERFVNLEIRAYNSHTRARYMASSGRGFGIAWVDTGADGGSLCFVAIPPEPL